MEPNKYSRLFQFHKFSDPDIYAGWGVRKLPLSDDWQLPKLLLQKKYHDSPSTNYSFQYSNCKVSCIRLTTTNLAIFCLIFCLPVKISKFGFDSNLTILVLMLQHTLKKSNQAYANCSSNSILFLIGGCVEKKLLSENFFASG